MAGTLGKPGVVTPRTASLDVQDTISQIRQRLEALEAHVATTATVNAAVKALQAQITSVAQTPAAGTSYATSAPVDAFIALYPTSATSVGVSDPTILSQAFGCFGVSVSSAPAGGKVSVATAGTVVSTSGSFTPFLPVFAGPSGILTQTPPVVSAIIQVGVALSATLVLVAPAPTLLNAVSINAQVDDFLPIARNPGTTWELNGVTIGVRRKVNFQSSGGVPITMTDNTSDGVVVISIGQVGVVNAANPLEDAWPWDYEEPEEDSWFLGYDDTVQANTSAVFAGLVEDAWPWDQEEEADETWWIAHDDSTQRLKNEVYSQDAWPWDYEEPEEDSWWWLDEVVRTMAGPLRVDAAIEDAWDWSFEEIDGETWWHGFDDAGSLPYGQQLPAVVPEDAWDWSYEEPEETLWWQAYDETTRVIQAIKAPALPQQDPWDWTVEDGDSELWRHTDN